MYINSWHIYDQSLTKSLVSFPHHPKPSSDFFGGVRSVDSRLPRRAELCTEVDTAAGAAGFGARRSSVLTPSACRRSAARWSFGDLGFGDFFFFGTPPRLRISASCFFSTDWRTWRGGGGARIEGEDPEEGGEVGMEGGADARLPRREAVEVCEVACGERRSMRKK